MKAAPVWSRSALALFDLSGATAVSAGAGSGKTTCLVELVTRLLSGEATGTACDPAEIVAITFTEKAATELAERLRAAVSSRAAAGAGGGAEARAWRARVHALDRMTVGTIHAFARRLLREHAVEAGVDPEFDVLDEEVATAWRRDAAHAAVVAALDDGAPEALLLAAAHGAGGLAAIVAEVIRERATRGHTGPLHPTPDRLGSALGLRSRLLRTAEALVDAGAEVLTASGRRALEQLREALAGVAAGDDGGTIEPTSLPRLRALAEALRGWRPGKSDGERARGLKAEVEDLAEQLLPVAAEVLATGQKRQLCRLVDEAERLLRERKRAAPALDFDDLLVIARDLLRMPRGPRDELRRRIRALLVDEYQDVNPVQQEIFDLLAADGGGAPGPVLVAVGDRKQSIYGFRGADVTVFEQVMERFRAGPPARVLDLAANHRSSPPVLDLVNTVSAHVMRPPPGAARPYELEFAAADRLLPVRTGGDAPPCEILDDGQPGTAAERRSREARAIAARIAALVSGVPGVRVPDPSPAAPSQTRSPRPGDIAILFRRLTHLAEYERALRDAGVSCRIARGGGFYQAPEVRELGELLASLADPGDALAWAALLRSTFCAIPDGALVMLARNGLGGIARREPDELAAALVAADPSATPDAERLRRFLRAWHELRAIRDRLPVSTLLSRAVEMLDVEVAHLASPDGERRVANVRKAIAIAARAAERGGTVAELAQRFRTMARQPPREPEADLEPGDAVALLSVHQAKGLEWPVVVVPDLGAAPPRDGRRAVLDPTGALAASFYEADADVHHATWSLALARAEASRAAAAESRRLLYVALTRARDRLVLSGEAARSGESWRSFIEGAIAGRPDLVVRIPLEEAATFACGPAALASAPGAPRPGASPRAAAADEARRERGPIVAAPAPLLAVHVAVTDLAEHARCPRRVLLHRMGAAEHGAGGASSQDDPDRATARGTLAHSMIAEADLAAPPLERHAQLAAAASRRGYDPRSPGVRRILADVTRFLASPAGLDLADAAKRSLLRREVPFLLRIDRDGAPSCYLSGALDAIIDGDREVAVIDFKYALPSPGAVDRYRFQLLAYAAAAARARPGRRVTTRLQFLRGPCRAVDLTPTDGELRRFVRELPQVAHAAYEGSDRTLAPSALGRTRERCAAERCGFVGRCYPSGGPGAHG